MFKFGTDIGGGSKLSLSTEHFKTHGDYPLRAEWPSLGDLVDTEFIRKTHTLNFTSNPNDYLNLDFNAYYTDHEIKTMKNGVKTYGTKLINKTKFGELEISTKHLFMASIITNMQSLRIKITLSQMTRGKICLYLLKIKSEITVLHFTPGITI